MFWLPLYHLFKGLTIIWLVFFGGAARIYELWLVRVLDSYEAALERGLGRIQAATASGAMGLAAAAVSKLQDAPQWVAAGAAVVIRAQAAGAVEGALAQARAQLEEHAPPAGAPAAAAAPPPRPLRGRAAAARNAKGRALP